MMIRRTPLILLLGFYLLFFLNSSEVSSLRSNTGGGNKSNQHALHNSEARIDPQLSQQFSLEMSPEGLEEFIRENYEQLEPFLSQTLKNLALEAYPKGTLVKTGDGSYLPIEQLEAGSTVIAYDIKNRKFVPATVTACRKAFTKEFLEVDITDRQSKRTLWQLPCRGKLYKPCCEGWLPFAPSEELSCAFIKKNLERYSHGTVHSIKEVHYSEPQETYLLSVRDYHNFIITDSDIIVHNFMLQMPALISWQFGSSLFDGALSIAGISIGSSFTLVAVAAIIGAVAFQIATSALLEAWDVDPAIIAPISAHLTPKRAQHYLDHFRRMQEQEWKGQRIMYDAPLVKEDPAIVSDWRNYLKEGRPWYKKPADFFKDSSDWFRKGQLERMISDAELNEIMLKRFINDLLRQQYKTTSAELYKKIISANPATTVPNDYIFDSSWKCNPENIIITDGQGAPLFPHEAEKNERWKLVEGEIGQEETENAGPRGIILEKCNNPTIDGQQQDRLFVAPQQRDRSYGDETDPGIISSADQANPSVLPDRYDYNNRDIDNQDIDNQDIDDIEYDFEDSLDVPAFDVIVYAQETGTATYSPSDSSQQNEQSPEKSQDRKKNERKPNKRPEDPDKGGPGWWKDTAAEGARRKIEDIVKESQEEERRGRGKVNSYNYQKPGSFNDTLKDFHDLNPQNVQKAPFDPKEPTKEVYHGQIGDDTLIARNTSKENYPTLELQRENFDSLKIRYK